MTARPERILAIETSSPKLSLALGDAQKIVAHYQGPLAWRHAEALFSGMQRLLKPRRLTPRDLTGVVVTVGPGSFTGIRIGLAAARALGQALSIPVVGVSSLETLAHGTQSKSRWICPMLDALRGSIFGSLFERLPNGSLQKRVAETLMPIEAWVPRVKKIVGRDRVVVLGDALALYEPAARRVWALHKAPNVEWYPSAKTLLQIGVSRLMGAGSKAYEDVVPLYLREAAAVERRKKK